MATANRTRAGTRAERQEALGAAERLYDRLVGRDPAAWNAAQALAEAAHAGNEQAARAWAQIARLHAERKRLGWGQIPAAKRAAAKNLYSRMKARDPKAWEAFRAIIDQAKQGSAKAHQAFAALSQEHNERKANGIISGGYWYGGGWRQSQPGPYTKIGAEPYALFGATRAPCPISPARRAEILSLIRRARVS